MPSSSASAGPASCAAAIPGGPASRPAGAASALRVRAPASALRLPRLPLAAAVAVAVLAAAQSGPAAAQSAAVPAAAAETDAAGRRAYDIVPGSLDQVLNRFAQEAGVELSVDSSLTGGRASAGLSGRYTVQEGFDRLVLGQGLQAVRGANGAYSLRAAPAPGPRGEPAQLPAVTVTGGVQETATGPVDGYVARRSATGTKTDTPIVETPQSISVVTADQIRTMHSQSIQDALGYTAGVQQGSAALNPIISDSLFVRGFQADPQFGSFYRDGMRFMANIYNGKQELYGLERLELLKGPSSILYGAAAPGGVVNAVSKRPLAEPYRELGVEYGSHDRRQVSGDFSGPLDEDRLWAYRLTVLGRESNTFIDHGRDDRVFVAPALTWRPSARTSLTLLASYQKSRQSDVGTLPIAGTLLPNPNGELPRRRYLGEPEDNGFDTTIQSAGYEFEHAFNDGLKLTHRLRKYESTLDYGYFLMAGMQDDRMLNRQSRFQHDRTSIWTSDTNLQYDLRTGPVRQTLLLGFDYSDSDYRSHRERGLLAPIDIYRPVYGGGVNNEPWRDLQSEQRQAGIYLQDQIKLYDKWVLLLGGRHDRYRTREVFNGEVTASRDSATTGRAGLVYLADNGLAPYLSYSQSFSPTAGTDAQGATYDADRGEQYEAGIRYQPSGSSTMVTASLYQLTRRNVLTPDPVNIGFSVQTGEVRSRGFELEVKSALSRSIDVIGAYAYTDARVTRSNIAGVQGTRFAGAPYHTASLWVDVNFGFAGLPGLTAGSGVRYVSGKPGSDADASFGVPGYTLVDARLAYDAGKWSYALNISNLTDKRYIPSVCYDNVIGCYYGAPRAIVASAAYRW